MLPAVGGSGGKRETTFDAPENVNVLNEKTQLQTHFGENSIPNSTTYRFGYFFLDGGFLRVPSMFVSLPQATPLEAMAFVIGNTK
ncbi:hypothetical protein [Geitlerinema sp. PCC 9228]|uniref:hypothetical protein n=1 Tax=Geitlerinema sp. PCC 9228 TaxID=111611 RepID=UPI0008F9D0EB|nr:hypothetical protein [Geitlerinema sp. PCC 9228]